MRADLEERRARQHEEGKIAMREYLENQRQTLQRMAQLRAQRLAKDGPSPSSDEHRDEDAIDEALKETFPASDPPAFIAPKKRRAAPKKKPM